MTDPNQTSAQVESEAAHPSFLQQLRAADQHALWKLGLRVAVCIFNILGIGCAAWIAGPAYRNPTGREEGAYGDEAGAVVVAPYLLIVVSASLIYCLICILIPVLRRTTHRPVHPGVLVGLDLVAWFSFRRFRNVAS